MKRFLSTILILSFLLCTTSCYQEETEPKGIAFYYCVSQRDYTSGSTVLSAEHRADVPEDSLPQALELYLSGPLSPDLLSPFPQNLKILGAYQEGKTVYLTLSTELAGLSGIDLTIACGCLTLTTLAIANAEQVEIRTVSGLLDGQRTIIMDKNTLLLLDTTVEGE